MEHHPDSPSVSMEDRAATPVENTSSIVNCPQQPISPTPISMDEDGDLHLVVGENKCLLPYKEPESDSESDSESDDGSTGQSEEDTTIASPEQQDERHEHTQAITYIVCSKSLSRASRVWKRLLYGSFAESEKPEDGTQWTVHLPEDDPESMRVILSITHSCFDQIIPGIERLYLDEMYALTVLTDKYDLTRVLRPWARGWTRRIWYFLHHRSELVTASKGFVQCLWVTWELGDQAGFELSLELIAHKSALSEDGKLQNDAEFDWGSPDEIPLFEKWMEPPGADDLIRVHRIKCLDFILDPFRRALEKPIDGGTPFTCRLHWNSTYKRECQATLIGSIIQFLGRCDLWPIPESALCLMSPESLRRRLFAENAYRIQGKKHNKCFKLCFIELGMDPPTMHEQPALKDFQEAHLVAQSKKSGVPLREETPAGELADDLDLLRLG